MDILLGYTRAEENAGASKLLQYNTRQFLVKMIPPAKSRRKPTAQPAAPRPLRLRARFPLPPQREQVRDIHIANNTERFYNDGRVQFVYKHSSSVREHARLEQRFQLQIEDLGRATQRFRANMDKVIAQRCDSIVAETKVFRRQRALNLWRWLSRVVRFWLRRDSQMLPALRIPAEPFAHPSAADFFEAIKFGKTARVRQLLTPNPALLLERDFFRLTALHWAAKRNNVETLLVLLEEPAYLECEDKYALTPLHYAVREKAYDAALALLVAGASPWTASGPPLLALNSAPELSRLIKVFRRLHITVRLSPKAERQKLFKRLVREKFSNEHLLQAVRFIG